MIDRRARTLMMVHAHPDDETSLTGGTLARYSAAGVRTVLVTCTDGGQGDDPDSTGSTDHDRHRVAARRAEELHAAAGILGVHELISLGYPDSGDGTQSDDAGSSQEAFSRRPIRPLVQRLIGVIRAYQPDVIVTYPPNGLSGHPDHIRTHDIVAAAHNIVVRDRANTAEDPLDSQESLQLFHVVVSRNRMSDLHRLAHAALPEEDTWAPPSEMAVDDDAITTTVDVSAFWAQKLQALAAHASQRDAVGLLRLLSRADSGASLIEEYIQVHPAPSRPVQHDLFATSTGR